MNIPLPGNRLMYLMYDIQKCLFIYKLYFSRHKVSLHCLGSLIYYLKANTWNYCFANTDHDLSLTTLKSSSVKIYSNTLGAESVISKLMHALATWIAANLI